MRITENENGFSPSERQYLLYRYLLEHTNREKVATPAEIKKYLEEHGIRVSTNTLYNDLRILGTAETFNGNTTKSRKVIALPIRPLSHAKSGF